jgi:hypothetical protein
MAVAEAVDFDDLEREAGARLSELRDRASRLSVEALTDPKVAGALSALEAEIRETEQTIGRVRIARREASRRDVEAREAAEATSRADAVAKARQLQADRERSARKVDSELRRFATALRAWDRITTEQETSLRRAGWSGERAMAARPKRWMIEAAIMRALTDAGCPAGIITLGSFTGALGPSQVRPLVELDGKPVEAEDGER